MEDETQICGGKKPNKHLQELGRGGEEREDRERERKGAGTQVVIKGAKSKKCHYLVHAEGCVPLNVCRAASDAQ